MGKINQALELARLFKGYFQRFAEVEADLLDPARLENEIARLEVELPRVQGEYESLRSQIADMRAASEVLRKERTAELAEHAERVKVAGSEYAAKEAVAATAYQAKIAELEASLTGAKARYEEEIARLRAERVHVEDAVKRAQAMLADLKRSLGV